MIADARTQAEIKSLVDEVWKTYALKDLDVLLDLWTPDPDLVAVVALGATADDVRLGREELSRGLQREFERLENIETAIEWVSISAAGNVAWSTANMELSATVEGNRVTLPCRLTNVYEKKNRTWQQMQLHISLRSSGGKSAQ